MTYRPPAVYGASKLAEAPRWIELRKTHPNIEWTARWPYMVGQVTDHPHNCKQFWLRDLADIQRADYVLILPPKTGVLRGALLEAGYAIALGKHVLLVGSAKCYGTWQYHPMVSKFPDLEKALAFIQGDWHE